RLSATAPHRAYGMNHVASREPVSLGSHCFAGWASGKQFELCHELRSGGVVNRAVHATAATERAVGGVDDCVDFERRNVSVDDLDHERWNVGTLERTGRGARASCRLSRDGVGSSIACQLSASAT